MTENEFLLCSIGFTITTIVTLIILKIILTITKRRNPYPYLLLVPGFIVANLISYNVSEMVDNGLTDQPILYGFPITFFRLTAWEGFKFQWIQFLLVMAMLLILSWPIGKAIQFQEDGNA